MKTTGAIVDADDCWTDHHLICFMMKRRVQKKQIWPRLNLESLDETTTQQGLQASFREILQQENPDDIGEHWSVLKSTILDTCKTTLGYLSRKHPHWSDEKDTEIKMAHVQEKESLCA